MATQVCFFFVALCIKLVRFSKKLPVYMFGAFAVIVNFMLRKFGRKTVKWTFMESRNKTFYHLFCKQFQIFKTRNLIYFFLNIHLQIFLLNLFFQNIHIS